VEQKATVTRFNPDVFTRQAQQSEPVPDEIGTLVSAVPSTPGVSFDNMLAGLKMDLTKTIPPPPAALKVNGEIVGTLGNFSLLKGKAKSKKTFLVTLAMAGALGVQGVFEGCLPKEKNKVVFIDTEQGEYHVLKVGKRVMRLLGYEQEPPDNFAVYGFRKVQTEVRKALVDHIIQTTPDLGLLVIDGIKDLIRSINDEGEATEMADMLLYWSAEYNIHIIVVLHENKNDKNARGHIGTELINKSETTIAVSKEPKTDVSKVEVEYGRNKEFTPFGFRVDDYGMPVVVEGWKAKDPDNGKTTGTTPNEIDPYMHDKIIFDISKHGERFSLSEIKEQIKLAVSACVEPIGDSKVKSFLTYYKNEGYLVHHGKEHSKTAYYTLVLDPDADENLVE
jgi:hypothetical protein